MSLSQIFTLTSKTPLITQLINIGEDEANRWRALFDEEKFTKNDIKLILLIYYYLKSSGLYSEEDNLFIISFLKYINIKNSVEFETFNKEITSFYEGCYISETNEFKEPVQEESSVDISIVEESVQEETSIDIPLSDKDNSIQLFIIDTLNDNSTIINYMITLLTHVLTQFNKKATSITTKCIIRHNTVVFSEKELDLQIIIGEILNILQQYIRDIKKILKTNKTHIVETFMLFRSNYTSNTSDFIQDILLNDIDKGIDVHMIVNIIRHSLYNLFFNFNILPHSNIYLKQIDFNKRFQKMLLQLKQIFNLVPMTLYVQFLNTTTSQSNVFPIQIEDIIDMSLYRRQVIDMEHYLQQFYSNLENTEISSLAENMFTLYINICTGIMDSIPSIDKKIQEVSRNKMVTTSNPSVHDIHLKLKTLLCDLNPKDILLELTKKTTDKKTLAMLFQKPDSSIDILTNPNILVFKFNIRSDHTIVLEEFLYFILGFCDQKKSGVLKYLGEIIDKKEDLYNFEQSATLSSILINVQNDLQLDDSDIEHTQVFYVECAELFDIGHIKNSIQSKPNILLELSSDIVSTYIK